MQNLSELATINQSIKLPYRYERGQPYKQTGAIRNSSGIDLFDHVRLYKF